MDLREFVEQEYRDKGIRIEPRPPWILVRVLPKESKYGNLFLPGNRQNKPVYEGQVIEVYGCYITREEWEEDGRGQAYEWPAGHASSRAAAEKARREKKGYTCKVVSPSVEVGDRVLFQHHEGVPVPELCGIEWKKGDWRLIREEVILGCLTAEEETEKEWLRKRLGTVLPPEISAEKIADHILEEAVVIPPRVSLTRSGA